MDNMPISDSYSSWCNHISVHYCGTFPKLKEVLVTYMCAFYRFPNEQWSFTVLYGETLGHTWNTEINKINVLQHLKGKLGPWTLKEDTVQVCVPVCPNYLCVYDWMHGCKTESLTTCLCTKQIPKQGLFVYTTYFGVKFWAVKSYVVVVVSSYRSTLSITHWKYQCCHHFQVSKLL